MADESQNNQSANVDYSQSLDLIAGKLDQIDGDLSAIDSEMGVIGDDVSLLASASGSASASDLDYSGQLAELGQVLVVTDVLLLVMLTIVVLNAGMNLGNAVVKWFRHE